VPGAPSCTLAATGTSAGQAPCASAAKSLTPGVLQRAEGEPSQMELQQPEEQPEPEQDAQQHDEHHVECLQPAGPLPAKPLWGESSPGGERQAEAQWPDRSQSDELQQDESQREEPFHEEWPQQDLQPAGQHCELLLEEPQPDEVQQGESPQVAADDDCEARREERAAMEAQRKAREELKRVLKELKEVHSRTRQAQEEAETVAGDQPQEEAVTAASDQEEAATVASDQPQEEAATVDSNQPQEEAATVGSDQRQDVAIAPQDRTTRMKLDTTSATSEFVLALQRRRQQVDSRGAHFESAEPAARAAHFAWNMPAEPEPATSVGADNGRDPALWRSWKRR